jgi:hypothetical protein
MMREPAHELVPGGDVGGAAEGEVSHPSSIRRI